MTKDEAWAYLKSLQYIPCRDQAPLAKTPRDWVIWHEMVAPERHDMAESLGNYFRDPRNEDGSFRYASTHFGVDDDSTVRYAEFYTRVYGTEGQGNTRGWHIEQAGLGTQSVGEWDDEYSRKMIEQQTTKLTAALCVVDDIPIRHVTPPELRNGVRGITTHYEMCQAFMQGMESQWHYDPKNFPIDRAIELTRKWAGSSPEENDMTPFDLFNECVPVERRANPKQASADEFLDSIARKCDDRFANGLFQDQKQKGAAEFSIRDIGRALLTNGPTTGEDRPTLKDILERMKNHFQLGR